MTSPIVEFWNLLVFAICFNMLTNTVYWAPGVSFEWYSFLKIIVQLFKMISVFTKDFLVPRPSTRIAPTHNLNIQALLCVPLESLASSSQASFPLEHCVLYSCLESRFKMQALEGPSWSLNG